MTTGKIYLARPHGMCAGVRRALAAVESVLAAADGIVYVLHEIVHNEPIVRSLTRRGVRFVNSPEEVPEGGILLFSAHGVGSGCEREARNRRLRVVDATCPLVKRLHRAAYEAGAAGVPVVLIGHRNHPEVEGIVGRMEPGTEIRVVESAAEIDALPFPAGTPVLRLCQTTLNTRETERLTSLLRRRFPAMREGPGVCYATFQRQEAVRRLAAVVPLVLIIGSARSSNSNRLREIAAESGAAAFLIDGPETLPLEALRNVTGVGVGAGASAPEHLVDATLEALKRLGFGPDVSFVGEAVEEPRFLPPELPRF